MKKLINDLEEKRIEILKKIDDVKKDDRYSTTYKNEVIANLMDEYNNEVRDSNDKLNEMIFEFERKDILNLKIDYKSLNDVLNLLSNLTIKLTDIELYNITKGINKDNDTMGILYREMESKGYRLEDYELVFNNYLKSIKEQEQLEELEGYIDYFRNDINVEVNRYTTNRLIELYNELKVN